MAADQRRVWTAIAASFDRTRQRPWPHVERFLRLLPQGSRVLDLMAGNGRHARVAAGLGLEVVAVDWSAPLLAKSPGHRLLADAAALPLADASVDACVFSAGLHGLPAPEARAACLRELRRVLRPGAPAQVTVWSRDAPRFSGAASADVEVPWRGDGHSEVRRYHLYSADSLRAALQDAGFTMASLEAVALAAPTADNLVAAVHKN
jgi:SAM-dependent methyltransferase